MIRILGIALLVAGCTATGAKLAEVRPNDNRTPAGRLARDTLSLRLQVRMATWHPEADTGRGITVPAFAEDGGAPQVPAPLIRVRTGTVIDAVVHNRLADSTVTLYGFHTRPAEKDDSLVLRPGDSIRVSFAAGSAGTYLYGAVRGKHVFGKDDEQEQLAGAFVIDPAEGSPPDRILVMNIWGQQVDSSTYRNALAINGRSWPYDERLEANVGDTVRWRVINATERGHPMHLHGFYFDVLSRGDSHRDTTYAPAAREMAVTDRMLPFATMNIRWAPDRPGNWLFHCHIGFHVVPEGARLDPGGPDAHEEMAEDPRIHMAGLVLGITVRASHDWQAPPRAGVRNLRLFIDEGARRGRAKRTLGFVLQRDAVAPARDSVEVGSSVLVLTRGQPTDITIINRLKERGAIHWHGVELESWSDGVAGWSGAPNLVAPSIQPGDSFVAHLTLPRAGTFMYHTHMNDVEQLTSGLFGGIVVLEPGQQLHPATDHLYVTGWDGPADPPHLLVNGDSVAKDLVLQAGVSHRFRFVNIGVAAVGRVAIRRDSVPVTWRAVAKDGADLPASQQTMRPAVSRVSVGETYDFTWTPTPGRYRLLIGTPDSVLVTQQLIVR